MAPKANPWLSPKVVTVNSEPNVFAAMSYSVGEIRHLNEGSDKCCIETTLSGLCTVSIK
jgi:hypothetical protein